MEASQFLETIRSILEEGRRRGLFLQTCQDDRLEKRQISLDGEKISFSSCSYLGLEMHPALIQGVHDAVARYGTQFSSSRIYLSSPLYEELEELLGRIFGAHAVVTSSTTMGHQAVFTSLISEKDAVVLDHQAHSSIHMAARLARTAGARVEIVRHGQIEQASALLKELASQYRTVWFACDGVYSMYGDLVPVGLLEAFLKIAPNIRLYVDDAHGMSWAGEHGRGSFLSRMPQSDRIVVATSLNKAFAAAGGCLLFTQKEEADLVRMCGLPMLFSGPVQNPMLGAAVASARLHLTDEIYEHQDALQKRVLFTNEAIKDAGFSLLVENDVPICFVQIGLPKHTFDVIQRVHHDGYFVNIAIYPGVPMRCAGIRLAITAEHTYEDIAGVVASIARHTEAVLEEEGLTKDALVENFKDVLPKETHESRWGAPKRAPKSITPTKAAQLPTRDSTPPQSPVSAITHENGATCDPASLRLTYKTTIHDVDPQLWDQYIAPVGACSWESMTLWEKIFSGQSRREHNWDFHYLLVHDTAGKLLCATFFTEVLNKDDMLMRAEVSEEVERLRTQKDDPYFLSSWCLMMGTMCSEGNHLYLDRAGPWKTALLLVLENIQEIYKRSKADLIMLRDLPDGDREMDSFLLEQGFAKTPMLDSHHLELNWQDDQEMLMKLDLVKRRYIRKYMLRQSEHYQVEIFGAGTSNRELNPEEIAHYHQLYKNVAERKLHLNVYHLPPDLLPVLLKSPAWELISLTLSPSAGGPEDGHPVAFYIAQRHETHYTPFFCGLDYDYVEEYGAYRQALYQCVRRAKDLGMQDIHMGMDADFLKSRLGTRRAKHCAYTQAHDHFQGILLNNISHNVSSQAPSKRSRKPGTETPLP